MSLQQAIPSDGRGVDGVIKLALLAVGGQGGGVLTGVDRGGGAGEWLCVSGDLGRGRGAAHRGHGLLY